MTAVVQHLLSMILSQKTLFNTVAGIRTKILFFAEFKSCLTNQKTREVFCIGLQKA